MAEISFKEKVKNIAIAEVKNYKKNFVDYEYLIVVDAEIYIIGAKEENFLHLVGVSTTLSAVDFYNKCFLGSLDESDFDLVDRYGKDLKGTVRRKISVINSMNLLMNENIIYIEKNFCKNRIVCTLGTSNNICTLGFIRSSNDMTARLFPKTLLKGNKLSNAKQIQLLLKKEKNVEKFDCILLNENNALKKNFKLIQEFLDTSLYPFKFKILNKVLNLLKKINIFKGQR